jgi:hypothetical protein
MYNVPCARHDGHCLVHGTPMSPDKGCLTGLTLAAVAEHRQWQYDTYGAVNYRMGNGTGPDVEWLRPVENMVSYHYAHGRRHHATAAETEDLLRGEWDYPKGGTPEEQDRAAKECSWMRLLREEVAEAFAQDDPER